MYETRFRPSYYSVQLPRNTTPSAVALVQPRTSRSRGAGPLVPAAESLNAESIMLERQPCGPRRLHGHSPITYGNMPQLYPGFRSWVDPHHETSILAVEPAFSFQRACMAYSIDGSSTVIETMKRRRFERFHSKFKSYRSELIDSFGLN